MTTRKRRRAGRLQRILNLNNSNILGAGGYGIVFSSGRRAIKLLYDLDACKYLYREAILQERAHALLGPIVPKVYSYMNYSTYVKGATYLCGIEMSRIPVLKEFGEPLHMLLGYDGADINQSWGRKTALPVGPYNPSRGFFAGPDLLDEILAEDGLTIEDVARLMGASLRTLLEGGILPNDLEWIYGGQGRIYLIDFGLCEFLEIPMLPATFLERKGSASLESDPYIPHKGNRAYEEFLAAFMEADSVKT